MKGIDSLFDLKREISLNENVWLLLYKKGSSLSECAFENLTRVKDKANNKVLLYADVNKVMDIHPEYMVNSVPTLLNFEKGELKNIIKGCHQPEQINAIFEKSVFIPSMTGKDKPQKKVTVYTTPTCTWCTTIKRHLQEHGIQYREVDVSVDQKAAEEMVRKSGQQGVPQTDINGEIIVGFDKTRINTLLGIN
jgi:glutaredoxin-like YruB-family protein